MSANGKSDELTPRQADFLARYLNPRSETYSNATQSALAAGYEREYADSITAKMPDWLAEYVGDNKIVTQALTNLQKALSDEGKEMIWWKATEFSLKSLARNKFGDSLAVNAKVEITPITGMQIKIENGTGIQNEESKAG